MGHPEAANCHHENRQHRVAWECSASTCRLAAGRLTRAQDREGRKKDCPARLSISIPSVRLDQSEAGIHRETQKKFSYGWVVVGIGALMTCVGMGAMMSLAVFLGADFRDDRLVARRRVGARDAEFPVHGCRGLSVGRAVRPLRHAHRRAIGAVLLGIGLVARKPGDRAVAVSDRLRRAGRLRRRQLLRADDRGCERAGSTSIAASPSRWSRPAWAWRR